LLGMAGSSPTRLGTSAMCRRRTCGFRCGSITQRCLWPPHWWQLATCKLRSLCGGPDRKPIDQKVGPGGLRH